MKKIILLFVLLFLHFFSFGQQSNATDLDSLYKKIDMSIPDIPAFKALGIEKSKILTPSTIRDFGASFSPFYNNGNLSFPQNFAVELAPAHLNNSLNTISNYNADCFKRWLLNSSVSIATNRDSNRTYLSIGYRSSFVHSKHDLKKNYFDLKSLDSLTIVSVLFRNIKLGVQDSLKKQYPEYDGQKDDTKYVAAIKKIHEWLGTNDRLKVKIGKDVDSLERILRHLEPQFNFAFTSDEDIKNELQKQKNDIAKNVIETFEARYWNATRFDYAVAFSAISPDSSAKGAEFYAFDVWATQSFRLNNWGQLLLGINARIPESDSSNWYNFAVTTRFYAGKNKVKGIVELQYQNVKNITMSENLLFSCGAEFKLSSSLWVVAMTGYQSKISGNFNDQIVANLNLKYGIN